MTRRARAAWVLLLSLASCAHVAADPIEPPADVPEGEDHVEAADDSLPGGEIELGLGLVGAGSSIERRRRVRFSGGDLSGTVREGSGDPLAGGALLERGDWGELAAGKLSPRWSRGLLLGSPGNPWDRLALDPRARRGRSGEGIDARLEPGVEVLWGRFAGHALAGGRLARGPATVGVLSGRGRGAQGAVGLSHERGGLELAFDHDGRWRAEGLAIREEREATIATLVRAGSPGFHSLAEPKRGGPARSLTLSLTSERKTGSIHAIASAWAFRPARAGARAALEVERQVADQGALVLGLEEQQGYRTELQSVARLRQGGWIEWSRRADPIGLLVRHELWGARPILRDVARVVSSCRIEARLPGATTIALAHTVFRIRRGESLYLREAESDRLVLRALSGEGQRAQLDVRLPLAHGALRASGQITSLTHGRTTTRWTMEWARRSRSSRDP